MDSERYGPAIAELLAEPRLPELGPGAPNRAALDKLRALTPEGMFPDLRDREMARACLAGLWLYHDFLDESHRISQDLPGETGSYWHGIMHRREPDADNAKYWFRRVGRHPVFPALRDAAAELARTSPAPDASFLWRQAEWDPAGFVNLCERARGSGSDLEALCRQVQLREWELLFDYCYRRASGG